MPLTIKECRVSFISAVNNYEKYKKCLNSIEQLYIPKDFDIEIITITDAYSLPSAYNLGMKVATGKYKVYLHQDVMIINPNFIKILITSFQTDPSFGIAGVVGCRQFPSSYVWWEGVVYGTWIGNENGKTFKKSCFRPYPFAITVEALDGLILCTQYDIPWRQDILKGFHFYDVSQCFEFQKHNYKPIVLPSLTPLVVHDCGVPSLNGYEQAKKIIKEEYKKL